MMKNLVLSAIAGLALVACNNEAQKEEASNEVPEVVEKIVTTNGTMTELLFAMGKGEAVVATDVTSQYPTQAMALPKIGHGKSIKAESIMAMNPTLVAGAEGDLSPEVIDQLNAMKVTQFNLKASDYTLQSALKNIKAVGAKVNAAEAAQTLIDSIQSDLARVDSFDVQPKVLFIYARGAATLLVGGSGSQVNTIIGLAGAKNAAGEMEGFKPLTPESLVEMNPDFILMFNEGAESLAGVEGILAVPGMDQTTAGKEQNFILMDATLLNNLGPRLGKAALQLNQSMQ